MTEFQAPLEEIRFVVNHLAGFAQVAALPGFDEVDADLADAVLDEAGKLATDILAPLNQPGDIQGCVCENGVVRTPDGFKQAYWQFVEGGWNSLAFDPAYGGQGLPRLLSTAVSEMWHSANMAFMLCPMLTQGAAEALGHHGSAALKDIYLAKLISGEWTGTMNLTEPQAGSDLGRIRTRAAPDGDHYRISGSKTFITFGEHDMAENIIHMVLARITGAPDGVKGISLFLVPKFLPKSDGAPGQRNDLRCVSIEHKLGINASPTAVMAFGDNDGAIGYLVGEENRGLEYMFTMMNTERLAVGLEGIGIAERAYQQAVAYARERIQSRKLGSDSAEAVAIIEHPDVRRMLLSMKSQTEATRGLAYFVAGQLDVSERHPDDEVRRRAGALVDLLTPVVKAWCSDTAIEVASTGIQVHGGMGFIEESGAPQHYRDARITAIYEGANGIQANDLVGRKVGRENGETAATLIAEMRDLDAALAASGEADVAVIRKALSTSIDALESATDWIAATWRDDPASVAAGAVPYLRLLGLTVGGWIMARAALAGEAQLADGAGRADFMRGKIISGRFFADQLLVETPGLTHIVSEGGAAVAAVSVSQL